MSVSYPRDYGALVFPRRADGPEVLGPASLLPLIHTLLLHTWEVTPILLISTWHPWRAPRTPAGWNERLWPPPSPDFGLVSPGGLTGTSLHMKTLLLSCVQV